jgi:hypothetical protein
LKGLWLGRGTAEAGAVAESCEMDTAGEATAATTDAAETPHGATASGIDDVLLGITDAVIPLGGADTLRVPVALTALVPLILLPFKLLNDANGVCAAA